MIASAARAPGELTEMVGLRAEGLPLEHVVGWAEFCGLRVAVDPGVFVPRPRTEALVRKAAALLSPGAVVVDLCCGSGAVGAALASGDRSIELHAADLDPAAVRCARRNLEHVYEGDLFDALPATLRGRVDVLAVNAPYVPSADVALLPREARLYEPKVALDGGADGLDVLRRVIAAAPGWLAPEGRLVTEADESQVPAVLEAATRVGLESRVMVACE